MEQNISEKKTIVLKAQVTEEEARKIVEKKKTKLFGSVLRKPNPDEIHVTIELFYEAFLLLGGKIALDYYRKAIHTVTVDDVVKEIVIGDGIFQAKTESRVWKKLKQGMKASVGMHKGKIDLEVEEHVVLENDGDISLNRQGDEIKFSYKINSEMIENYPTRILSEYEKKIRKLEINLEDAVQMLSSKLMTEEKGDIRMVSETLSVYKTNEIYVPIYEARCNAPPNKVSIFRIDAISRKIL